MQEQLGANGCPIFIASVTLDLFDQSKMFKWGVILDGPQGANFWGIPTEVQDVNSAERHRQFRLSGSEAEPQVERYYVTYGRRLGANKHFASGSACILPFGLPTRKRWKWFSGIRLTAILPTTAPGLIRRCP
jgi:1,4-alpha-glucan branching enzyme